MNKGDNLLALDVGEQRIGVAVANSQIKIAVAYDTIEVDGTEIEQIERLVISEGVDTIIIGYPRNQSGEPTRQTAYVEAFSDKLVGIVPNIIFQDESLTSVKAEEQLKAQNRPYGKADIDALAASYILEDYMEQKYGRF